jgi:hypothetical protein
MDGSFRNGPDVLKQLGLSAAGNGEIREARLEGRVAGLYEAARAANTPQAWAQWADARCELHALRRQHELLDAVGTLLGEHAAEVDALRAQVDRLETEVRELRKANGA